MIRRELCAHGRWPHWHLFHESGKAQCDLMVQLDQFTRVRVHNDGSICTDHERADYIEPEPRDEFWVPTV